MSKPKRATMRNETTFIDGDAVLFIEGHAIPIMNVCRQSKEAGEGEILVNCAWCTIPIGHGCRCNMAFLRVTRNRLVRSLAMQLRVGGGYESKRQAFKEAFTWIRAMTPPQHKREHLNAWRALRQHKAFREKQLKKEGVK